MQPIYVNPTIQGYESLTDSLKGPISIVRQVSGLLYCKSQEGELILLYPHQLVYGNKEAM